MKRKISLIILLVLCFSLLMTAFVGAQEAESDKIEFNKVTINGEDFNYSTVTKPFNELIYELSEDGTYYTVTGTSAYSYASTLEVPTTYMGIEVRYVNLSVLKALAEITVPVSVQVLDGDNIYTLEEANNLFDLKGELGYGGTKYIFSTYDHLAGIIIDYNAIPQTNYLYKGNTVYELSGSYYIFDGNGFTDVSEYQIFFIDSSLPDFVIDILEIFVNILEPPYTWIINLF